MTVKDSKDALARLKRLRSEIDVAMKKGTFTGANESATPASSSSNRKSAITPPPKPGAGQLSQAAKDYLASQGISVP